MTDRELKDFIEHGENNFMQFALLFGEGWAKQALEIAKEYQPRLAQLEQDDGYCQACDGDNCTAKEGCVAYDNPPKKEWVGLTDEEILQIAQKRHVRINNNLGNDLLLISFVRAIEAKLKEKNNG